MAAVDRQTRDAGPRISAVVPATDSPPTLLACVKALRAAGVGDDLVVVTEPAGDGPAAARNRGVDRASGDLIVFVDADVVVHPDALERIERGSPPIPGSRRSSAPTTIRRRRRSSYRQFRNLLHHHVHSSSPGPAETFWAGLGAVRREPFLAAGGFDAGRFPAPAVEDIELGRRLRRRDERIVLDPGCEAST